MENTKVNLFLSDAFNELTLLENSNIIRSILPLGLPYISNVLKSILIVDHPCKMLSLSITFL